MAVLNKLNFLHGRPEWSQFTRQPLEPASEVPAAHVEKGETEDIDYDPVVLEHAKAVFVEPTLFMHRHSSAIAATEDRPIADPVSAARGT
ncbi:MULTISPECIES: hypothetical protein [Rhizobium]|uniref:Uncharacterized protein n=1 Tax=Rhizobium paranaense TaxID=1650438 RepID=A0A7W8XSD5_9HYPH|nr:hypothetical protein [Rhizobium paranaense]MBB5574707.1 hypothetical protein [Rhizobium paranaense]